jgi:hypothetical protein
MDPLMQLYTTYVISTKLFIFGGLPNFRRTWNVEGRSTKSPGAVYEQRVRGRLGLKTVKAYNTS